MDILLLIEESYSINDLAVKLYGYCNGRTITKTLKILEDNNLDRSTFDGKNKNTIYEKIEKTCPVCNKSFLTQLNKKEKTTCSHSCANAYFKHGINNPDIDNEKKKISIKKYPINLKKNTHMVFISNKG